MAFNQRPTEILMKLWEEETGTFTTSSLNLSIELSKRLSCRWIVEKENGETVMLEDDLFQPIKKSYSVDSKLFLHPSSSLPFVSDMLALADINMPGQPAAIQRISSLGNKMANSVSVSNTGEGRKLMSMCVDICVMEVYFCDERAAMARALQVSMDEASGSGRVIPASRSSIDALQRVRFDGRHSDSIKNCTICLEELTMGSLVTGLPCNHLFHGECITRWLETSHLCPLCRFKMPI